MVDIVSSILHSQHRVTSQFLYSCFRSALLAGPWQILEGLVLFHHPCELNVVNLPDRLACSDSPNTRVTNLKDEGSADRVVKSRWIIPCPHRSLLKKGPACGAGAEKGSRESDPAKS